MENIDEVQYKRKAKRNFIIFLITFITLIIVAIVGFVFAFYYIETLGLYTALIIGGGMAVLVALSVLTTVWYNRAYKD